MSNKLETTNPNDLSQDAIDNLDIKLLKDKMLKGIYVLEMALFDQASFEHSRIGQIRNLITTLESDLMSPEALMSMDPGQKIQLYRTLMQNMNDSMKFLQDLHKNVESGLNTVSSIEKIKEESKVPDVSLVEEPSSEMIQLKGIIESAMKKKLTESKATQ